MASTEPDVRIFVRESDGKTRKVTSESAAVNARFDGFFEQKPGTKAPKAATSGSSTNAANNAG